MPSLLLRHSRPLLLVLLVSLTISYVASSRVLKSRTAPKIKQRSQTILVSSGKATLLNCDVRGHPKPSRTWERAGKPVRRYGRRFSVNKKTFALRIFRLKPEDEGNYTCIAKNRAGVANVTFTLILASKPRVSILPLESDVITENDTVKVTCRTHARPKPHIGWSVNNRILHSDSKTVINNVQRNDRVLESELTIARVSYDDRGTYTCRASNGMGSDSDTVHLDVLYPPHVLSPQPDDVIHWWDGHITNLTCDVTANDPPEVTWLFTDVTGATVSLAGEEERSEDGCLVKSTVGVGLSEGESRELSGTYTCRAENNLGNLTVHEFHVNRAYAPSSLTLTPLTIAPYEMVVSITVLPQPDTPTVEYIQARYREQGDEQDDFQVTCGVNKEGYCHATLLGVMPDRKYVVSAQAKNKVGLGQEVSMVVKTGVSEYGWTMHYTSTQDPNGDTLPHTPSPSPPVAFTDQRSSTSTTTSTTTPSTDITANKSSSPPENNANEESTPSYQLLAGPENDATSAHSAICVTLILLCSFVISISFILL
ncbi:neural cell adhesion molecule 1-B [Aplysia californica]|uniref:Neural cell adhesion molecule 1-B n=1 Tax=Aplysia californica TaxID=6500 RepID=A0ABM0K2T1_APLCA|nr:neural cell adhesion molecule 1-B [Aplysia californica]